MSLGNRVLDLDLRPRIAGGTMLNRLLLPREAPEPIVVVLAVDLERRLVGVEVSHDVTPALVVVHPDRNCNALALGRQEANNPRWAIRVQGKDEHAVHLGPNAIAPNGLLDDVEEPTSGVGLVYTKSNRVRHHRLL